MRTGGLSGQNGNDGDTASTAGVAELAGLTAAVEGLSVPAGGDALVELLGLADRLQARISAEIDGFDRAGLWELEGASSLMGWLKDRGAMSNRTAPVYTKTVRRLRHCPTVLGGWADGVLSSGQIEAVVANVSDRTVDLFEAHGACTTVCVRGSTNWTAGLESLVA